MLVSSRFRALVMTVALLAGACVKKPIVTAPPLEEDALVQLVRSRPVPDSTQARFSIKMRSKPLGIAAPPLGGGLVIARPGRAHVAILGPTGSPVVTLSSDGQRVVFLNAHDRQYISAENAVALLGGATGDAITLDDVALLLLGLLPVEASHVRSKDVLPEGVQFVFDGPAGTVLTALIDPTNGTPVRVSVDDAQGKRTVEATYDPFMPVDTYLLPSRIELAVPSVELSVDLKFKSWTLITELPDVFSPVAPDGYEVMTMDEYGKRMADKLKAQREDAARSE